MIKTEMTFMASRQPRASLKGVLQTVGNFEWAHDDPAFLSFPYDSAFAAGRACLPHLASYPQNCCFLSGQDMGTRKQGDGGSRSLDSGVARGLTAVHVTTLDEVVSVNSFFTVAVFIGLSLVVPTTNTLLLPSPKDPHCLPGPNTIKNLLVFMVIAFSCFQFSSLVAHGMKLGIVLKNGEMKEEPHFGEVSYRVLRMGMAAAAVGTVAGTMFLMLALLNIVQLRLGRLGCDAPLSDRWAERAAIPLLILVPGGCIIFVTSVFHGLLFH